MSCRKYVQSGLIFMVFFFIAGSAMSMSKISSNKDEEKKGASILEDVLIPANLDEQQVKDWKNGVPPGWSKGEKTGWQGKNMPPGLAKKHGAKDKTKDRKHPGNWDTMKKGDQTTWTERMEKIKERISKAKKDQEAETMLFSAEEAAGAGVPLDQLDSLTDKFIKKQLSAEEYEKTTRAMAYGVDRKVDFKQLGTFVNTNIDQGVRGDELAVKIYREIASRSAK